MRPSEARTTVLLAAVWLAAMPSSRAECLLEMAAAMPLHSVGDHFAISTTINGHASDLLLDTGFFTTTISAAAAGRLGLRPIRYPGQVAGIGGYQDLYTARVASMKIGRMNADGATLGVSNLGALEGNAAFDGVFGMNMMSHYDIDLDIVGRQVVLFQAEGNCGKPAVTLAPDLYAVKLEAVRSDQEADVTVTVDGHRLRAELDTGAASTAIFRKAASRLGIDLSGLEAAGAQHGRGIGGFGVAAMNHVFKAVDIGDLRIENMPVTILGQRDSGIDRHHVGSLLEGDDEEEPGAADMLLGADFMRKVHLWISHSSHTLVMQYPPKPSPPLPKG